MPTPALPESCSRLTSLFQGELFAVDDWRCAGHDTPHRREEWSDEDHVVVTRRGAWELAVEGEARRADPLTATLWNRGAYRVRHPVGGRDECTVFRLTAAGSRAMRELMSAPGVRHPRRTFAARSVPIDGAAWLLHRRALASAARDPGASDALAVEERGIAFLGTVADATSLRRATDTTHAPAARRHVERARDVLARDFRLPLTLAGIGREAGCSPFHLSRLFRRTTGMTLHRAVLRMRLREGLERLLDEPDGITAIALATGFASHSHFTDAFRAEFGCAPTEARRLLRTRDHAPGKVTRPCTD